MARRAASVGSPAEAATSLAGCSLAKPQPQLRFQKDKNDSCSLMCVMLRPQEYVFSRTLRCDSDNHAIRDNVICHGVLSHCTAV